MQNGIQKGLLLLMTVIFAITISGFVSATDVNGYCADDKYSQCQYNDQNPDSNNYCNSMDQKCQTSQAVCNDKKTCEKNLDEKKCQSKCEQKCIPPKVCPKCTSTIGDRVWNDSNTNGIQDVDEKGIANVTVNLWNGTNDGPSEVIATTKTDANGNYYFTNLVKGIYWLQFILPTATDGTWKFSPQDQGTDDTVDSDPNASGIAGPIDLTRCICDPSWDAGLIFTPAAAGGGEVPPAGGGGEQAAGGEEIPLAAGGEELAAAGGEGPTVAAAGEVVALQETGVPLGMLLMAVLMVLAGLIVPKRK